MSTEVSAQDPAVLQDSIADVRSDATDTDWVLVGHVDSNPNVVDVVATGSDGIDGLVALVDDTKVMYGLVRIHEKIDMSTTTKFAFIRWIGDAVPRRGKFGVVSGSIQKHFSPYQVVIDADSPDDLKQESIMDRIQETSGTKSKVLDASEAKTRPERGFTSNSSSQASQAPTGNAPRTAQKTGTSGSSFTGMAKGSAELRVNKEVRDCLDDIRDDKSPTVWCVTGFEDNDMKKNPLKLIASGEGTLMDDVESIVKLFTPGIAAYAFIRTPDKVDEIMTVKFACIQWVGESVKPMKKAKLATQKGNLEAVFKPAHVNIFATSPSEVSYRAIMDKVSSASGSKSHVKC